MADNGHYDFVWTIGALLIAYAAWVRTTTGPPVVDGWPGCGRWPWRSSPRPWPSDPDLRGVRGGGAERASGHHRRAGGGVGADHPDPARPGRNRVRDDRSRHRARPRARRRLVRAAGTVPTRHPWLPEPARGTRTVMGICLGRQLQFETRGTGSPAAGCPDTGAPVRRAGSGRLRVSSIRDRRLRPASRRWIHPDRRSRYDGSADDRGRSDDHRSVLRHPVAHRVAGRAAVGRGPDRPVDARREPDQVAPGPHHLVLRDLPARCRICPGYRAVPSRLTATCSTPTTRGSGPGIPATTGAWCPDRAWRRSPPTGATSTRPWPRCSTGPSGRRRLELVELGIQHEQQHQELLLMDIKHVLSRNPLLPGLRRRPPCPRRSADRRAHAGPSTRRGPSRSATPERASASTTSSPATACTSGRSPSPTGR